MAFLDPGNYVDTLSLANHAERIHATCQLTL
jgi:hypothetical protein